VTFAAVDRSLDSARDDIATLLDAATQQFWWELAPGDEHAKHVPKAFGAGPARIRTWDQGIMSPLL
jgi:hypothetical protein